MSRDGKVIPQSILLVGGFNKRQAQLYSGIADLLNIADEQSLHKISANKREGRKLNAIKLLLTSFLKEKLWTTISKLAESCFKMEDKSTFSLRSFHLVVFKAKYISMSERKRGYYLYIKHLKKVYQTMKLHQKDFMQFDVGNFNAMKLAFFLLQSNIRNFNKLNGSKVMK